MEVCWRFLRHRTYDFSIILPAQEALANEKRSHDLALSKDTTDGTDSREASEKLRAENAAMANRIREADAAIAAIDSLVAKKHFLQHQLQQKYVEQQLQLQQQQDAAEPPTRVLYPEQ